MDTEKQETGNRKRERRKEGKQGEREKKRDRKNKVRTTEVQAWRLLETESRSKKGSRG